MAKRTEARVSSGEIGAAAIRNVLINVRAYSRAGIDEMVRSMEMKRRCCQVPIDDTVDWLEEQEHPITIFDFSDWCDARSKQAGCGKEVA